jgi:hypothetical protein
MPRLFLTSVPLHTTKVVKSKWNCLCQS